MGRYPISVELIVGIVLGFLSGLGVGGGTLLILWLGMACGMEPSTARQINLMFFIVAAGAATLVRWKKGNLHFSAILPAIISGMLFAGVFAFVSTVIDPQPLKRLFGVLLIAAGLRELFYRPRKAK